METIGGTIRKYNNNNKSITSESYYHQARTIGKRITKGVEQMRFGADRWEEKTEWYEPSKSLETIIEARYQNHRPHFGMIELVRNIWDEKGWINYISKKELKGYQREVMWKYFSNTFQVFQ
jgi:hypothetical protein